LGCCTDKPMLADLHTRARDLLARLERVPAVGKQRRLRRIDQKQSGTPGETAQIPNVGKMRHQEGVDAEAGKGKPEPAQSCFGPAPAQVSFPRLFRHAVRLLASLAECEESGRTAAPEKWS